MKAVLVLAAVLVALPFWARNSTGAPGEQQAFERVDPLSLRHDRGGATAGHASLPVESQPESDNFRISFMLDDEHPFGEGFAPAVACNPSAHECLVVWDGYTAVDYVTAYEFEIWGQRVGEDGGLIGDRIRISDAGGYGDPAYGAGFAAVTYNPLDEEYLVVWFGDDSEGGLVNDEYEIFGQRLAADGTEVGSNDFRISDMVGIGQGYYAAGYPKVVHNPDANEYLVVWMGYDDVGGLAWGEYEIFGQRLAADGTEVGSNDFRISDLGGTGDDSCAAQRPDLAYNPASNRYLVVWYGDDDEHGLAPGEHEIFGQLLAADGSEIGTNDFLVSDAGGTGNNEYYAERPTVACDPDADRYLVAWYGDDNEGGMIKDEIEIFGQLLTADGIEIGANDFPVSDMGDTGDIMFAALYPDIAFNLRSRSYVVVWRGFDNQGGLDSFEFEIFGQQISANGTPVGADDFRISYIMGTGFPEYPMDHPAVACTSPHDVCLAVWQGDILMPSPFYENWEVAGQRLVLLLIFSDGFEHGTTAGWTATVP